MHIHEIRMSQLNRETTVRVKSKTCSASLLCSYKYIEKESVLINDCQIAIILTIPYLVYIYTLLSQQNGNESITETVTSEC